MPKEPSNQKVQLWRLWALGAIVFLMLGFFVSELADEGMKYAKFPLISAGVFAFALIYDLWKYRAQRS